MALSPDSYSFFCPVRSLSPPSCPFLSFTFRWLLSLITQFLLDDHSDFWLCHSNKSFIAVSTSTQRAILWPFIPSLSSVVGGGSSIPAVQLQAPQIPVSLDSFPQPEVNTLWDGAISSTASRQYKNSEWTAQSLFHLRFDCNGIACSPWESPNPPHPPTPSSTLGLYGLNGQATVFFFLLDSKNPVNNSMAMRRLRCQSPLQPGLPHSPPLFHRGGSRPNPAT